VVWKRVDDSSCFIHPNGCVRTIVVWKLDDTAGSDQSTPLRENHSGMETVRSLRQAMPWSNKLRKNHSGMETVLKMCCIGSLLMVA